jgi:NAD(P)-dependent dehydrogenase (short-subunit alcohol dehydrogenase family)
MASAIVTGGNSGIGRAAAVALARCGCDIGIAWHEDEPRAQETIAECEDEGVRAVARRFDLEELPAAASAIDELADELGGLSVLVNCAATTHRDAFLELGLETFRRVIDVDLTAQFLCAQAAARRMIALGRGGRIINITSVHEHVPLQGSAAYCAAKHGLGGLTKAMALELAEHDITVNAVAPGEVATRMTGHEDEDALQLPRPGIPAGRPGDAREIGAAIAFLPSSEASYVTGRSYVVDGGMLLMGAMANLIAQ